MEETEYRKTCSRGKATTCSQNGRMNICTGCKEPIEDRFLMKVVDEAWHESCLQCCICRTPLSRSCFSKDRKLYCRTDYEKVFGTKCSGCKKTIPANELVMRALGNVYHLQCFVCAMCGHVLEKGQEFALKDNKLYCKVDFAKLPKQNSRSSHRGSSRNNNNSNSSNNNNSSESNNVNRQQENVSNNTISSEIETKKEIKTENSDSDDSSVHDGDDDDKKGPKRPRTILTSQQRKVFKSAFEISSKPCRKVREELSRETGLSVRVVQVWFQNQRAKVQKSIKKLARRNNPESEGASSCRVSNRQRSIKKSKDGKGSSPREKRRGDRDLLDIPSSLSPSQGIPVSQSPYGMLQAQYQGLPNHMGSMVPPGYPYQQPLNHMDSGGEMTVEHTMQALEDCMMPQHQYPQEMSGYPPATNHNGL